MSKIVNAWFVRDMVKATSDMWLKGWDERNGGNISLRLTSDELADYLGEFYSTPRYIAITEPVIELANQYFIVTGSGQFFRNVALAPAETLGLVKINDTGTGYYILWGLTDGRVPTSEFAAHFQSHIVRMKVTAGQNRVIMHCHATNLIALSYVLELDTPSFTRQLWEMSTECLVVFPQGIGLLPWMVPGTDEIGLATARLMENHELVLWPFHGIFGAGTTLDNAFGLIDTAEKSAEILVKVLAMGGKKQTITTQNLLDLAQRFQVSPLKEALN